jgi:hypothetical protein
MASEIPDTMLSNIWDFSLSRLKITMAALGNSTTQFPRGAPQTGGKWQMVSSSDWTSGFYPGCFWFAYEKSKDTTFTETVTVCLTQAPTCLFSKRQPNPFRPDIALWPALLTPGRLLFTITDGRK